MNGCHNIDNTTQLAKPKASTIQCVNRWQCCIVVNDCSCNRCRNRCIYPPSNPPTEGKITRQNTNVPHPRLMASKGNHGVVIALLQMPMISLAMTNVRSIRIFAIIDRYCTFYLIKGGFLIIIRALFGPLKRALISVDAHVPLVLQDYILCLQYANLQGQRGAQKLKVCTYSAKPSL